MAAQALIQRPVPDNNEEASWDGSWEWVGDLRTVKQTDEFTVYERDATLRISEKQRQTGAWHRHNGGQVFTRTYVVPTNRAKCGKMKDMSQSLGRWAEDTSSWYSFLDHEASLRKHST